MSAGNPEKATRYLALLDNALCNAQWAEVPELARKVDKHAPDRKCLTLTARSEAQIASASHRPESAGSSPSASIHGLSELKPRLRDAIAAEKTNLEDVFQARVCLAFIYYLQGEHAEALKAVPHDLAEGAAHEQKRPLPGWTQVCMAKGAYIKSSALETSGQEEQAGTTFQAAALLIGNTGNASSPEFRAWAERLLGRGCLFAVRYTKPPTIRGFSSALRVFDAWGNFWQNSRGSNIAGSASRLDVPRRRIWRLYYSLLSAILQFGYLYTPGPGSDPLLSPLEALPDELYVAARRRQRAQLRHVEATYESLLVQETQFPKASQTNEEVERWVQQVADNWKIFCCSAWADEEIGDGGRESVSRGVLDILYRAATKTFHSTAILRQLFTLHASLGEFDLAMHAFDSYMQIIGKGKARAEKTGHLELGVDDDDTALLTAVEAVRILCRYGDREQGEKAVEIGKNIEKWLSQHRPGSSRAPTSDGKKRNNIQGDTTESQVSPKAQASAYRAIGISQAHWSRLTYEHEKRSELQGEALKYLRRAETHDRDDVETAYALALLLAETRDVPAAITTLKAALAPKVETNGDAQAADYSRERRLIPLWHLLTLCLTARDDYDTAIKTCKAAFEQFSDPSILFGRSNTDGSTSPRKTRSTRGLVDQMEGFEKECIIEVKMTEMAFLELTEGPDVAVDQSDELLSLYARLYGKLDDGAAPLASRKTAATQPPQKSGGTLRSIAGSIVKRPGASRRSVERNTFNKPASEAKSETSTGDGQQVGAPITIQVTDEDGKRAGEKHHHHRPHLPFKMRGHHGDWREAKNLRSKSPEIPNEKAAFDSSNKPPSPPPKDTETVNHQPRVMGERHGHEGAIGASEDAGSPSRPNQPLRGIPHNIPRKEQPLAQGHGPQAPEQDVRLPAPHPAYAVPTEPRFPTTQERRQKISLLVKIWLFIGGLYLRSEMLDDAKGAVDEAFKLTEAFELEVAKECSSAKAFYRRGWGGGKVVDQLWADVWAERGNLALSRQSPHDALDHFDQALVHYEDHPEAILRVSDILLDIYEEKIPAELPRPLLSPLPTASGSSIEAAILTTRKPRIQLSKELPKPAHTSSSKKEPSPAELNRLASRDRAYMLLTTLTHLGTGWNDSEAWYTLARAHELSNQVEKAKAALWWCVELEDAKPIRPWSEVAAGGFTL